MRVPQEGDLLLPFELVNVRGSFREYLKAKRDHFFATIDQFPELWKFFLNLDDLWMRGIANLEKGLTGAEVFIGFLFLDSHTQFRTSLELGFSCCFREATNVLRTGIESAVQAHKIFREPHVLRIRPIGRLGLRTELGAQGCPVHPHP